MTPTVSMLREIFSYNPETGAITYSDLSPEFFGDTTNPEATFSGASWKERRPDISTRPGYLGVKFFNKVYPAHRVAYCMHHGTWPRGVIDHINGDKTDNRIGNLRCVTVQENGRNCKLYSSNVSGRCGVSWEKDRSKWYANIKISGKNVNLGRFYRIEDAVKARVAAEVKYGFHENHGVRR